jgi:hypothetical protein
MSSTTERIDSSCSRRVFLQLASVGAFSAIAAGCQKTPSLVCSDPARLSDAESSLRASLHYTEQSSQAAQVCGGCAFFESAQQDACANCTILNGSVNPKGHCDSWSAPTQ